MTTRVPATIDDLYEVPDHGKAELIDGEVITMSPTGFRPGRAAARILASLLQFEQQIPHGYALGDNVGFVIDLPNRKSVSPDAAFYVGPETGGKFVQGAPIFAVEVRSDGDYGMAAERAIMRKRADYFAAGTQIVWDVDVLRDGVVHVYRASDPTQRTTYSRDELAEAEPALPGWRYAVNDLFR
ncbi:MAG: Uma2 family endonuclease [Herpetosiphonaceae bacterium]|nr:Uma2 family endonuclease [Herpetosiphonaceae bacterium]